MNPRRPIRTALAALAVPLALAAQAALPTAPTASAAGTPVQSCTRISRLQDGTAPAEGVNTGSTAIDVSPDGRFVAYSSFANGIVPGDLNGYSDVFLYDAVDGSTTMISTAGVYGDTDDDSYSPAVSDDGSVVAFVSQADDLAAGDTNAAADAFVWRRASMSVTLESLDHLGGPTDGFVEGLDLSSDGRVLVYSSSATRVTSPTGDTNGAIDVFRKVLATGATTLVSQRGGVQNDRPSRHPVTDRDGDRVAFLSETTPGTGLFPRAFGRSIALWRASDRRLTLVSTGSSSKRVPERGFPSISADGRRIAYTSNVPGDTGSRDGLSQAVVWDQRSGRRILASRRAGAPADGAAVGAEIAAGGKAVLFQSQATNLGTKGFAGPNTWRATLGRGRYPTALVPLDRTPAGRAGSGASSAGGLSGGGGVAVLTSRSTALVAGGDPADTNDAADLFRCTRIRRP